MDWCLVGRLGRAAALTLASAVAWPLAWAAPLATVSLAVSPSVADEPVLLDQLVLRSGRVIEGKILSETADEVRMTVIVAGISAPATYKMSDILQIVRADRPEAESANKPQGGPAGSVPAQSVPAQPKPSGSEPVISADATAPRVYVVHLEGVFGKDITPTPVRDAVEAAKKEQPDFLIVYLNNDWSFFGGEIPDDYQVAFDWFEVADQIEPILTKEIELGWEKRPHVVFWVRNAMGGAAFLPFVADEIYMHEQGRIGGIGTLEQMFEGVGDEVVRQKQRSLRLARGQGLAISGGYDYRLIDAMARLSYVACYDQYGNIFERMPENPGELLLTDDGKEENIDTVRQRVTGDGNDVLTLKHDVARLLGVSRGTANTLDELLEHLGILRNHVMIDGRSDRILKSWSEQVKRAERQIPRLWTEYGEVQAGGDPAEARRAIGTQIRILEEMQGLYRRYGEGFDPFSDGVPNIADLELRIEQHRMQLLLLD